MSLVEASSSLPPETLPHHDVEETSSNTPADTTTTDSQDLPSSSPEASAESSLEPSPDSQTDSQTHNGESNPAPADLSTARIPDSISQSQESESSSSSGSPHPSEASNESPVASTSTAPSSTRTSLADSQSQTCSQSGHPTGILRSPIIPQAVPSAVSFAPLPQIDQRKRTNTVPLGVAARSRMLRARRMRLTDPDAVGPLPERDGNTAHLTLEQMRELEELRASGANGGTGSRRPQVAMPLWKNAPVGFSTPEEDAMPEEDALLALGRMVKGGARTLWRRVSQAQLKDRAKEAKEKDEKPPMPGLRRSVSLSEPRTPTSGVIEGTNGGESLKVSVLVKEPQPLFDEQDDKGKREAGMDAVEAVKVTETVHGGISEEEEEEEQEGRVWEEVVGDDVARRMEVIEQSKSKDTKERKPRLVERLACLTVARTKKPKSQ